MLPTSFAYFGLSNVLALLNDVVIVGPNETIDGPNVANGSLRMKPLMKLM